jgi:hypothetical protein
MIGFLSLKQTPFSRRIFPPVSGVFSVGFILFEVGELTKISELI